MRARIVKGIVGAAASVLVALLFLSPGRSLAEETAFIRGDANGDGGISISDAHWSLGYLFRNKAAPSCVKAADVNDNGVVDITDSIVILGHLFLAQGSPCEPFPEAGTDPTSDGLSCDSYGGGASVVDDAARIEIVGGVAGDDGTVFLKVQVSSSRPVAGFSGVLSVQGNIFAEGQGADITEPGEGRSDFRAAMAYGGKLSIGLLFSLIEDVTIGPGTGVHVVDLSVKLRGAAAGEYALTLESGELIDAETGMPIAAALSAGSIQVASPVAGWPDKQVDTQPLVCDNQPPDPPDPPDPGPSVDFLRGDVNTDGTVSISDALMVRRYLFNGDRAPPCFDAADADDSGKLDVTDVIYVLNQLLLEDAGHMPPPYPVVGPDPTLDWLGCTAYEVVTPEKTDDVLTLGAVDAVPGQDVEIPVYLTSARETEALQLLFRAVPDVITLTSVSYNGRMDAEYKSILGSEDGVYRVGLVPRLIETGYEIPPGEDRLILRLGGEVSDSAEPGTVVTLEPVENYGPFGLRTELTYRGTAEYVTVIPTVVEGYLRVVADLAIFIRGDSNHDETVDMSDAVSTLDHLFRGGAEPPCLDAADANDDGTLDISDPIATLRALYLGTGPLPPPTGTPGFDPSPDALDCVY